MVKIWARNSDPHGPRFNMSYLQWLLRKKLKILYHATNTYVQALLPPKCLFQKFSQKAFSKSWGKVATNCQKVPKKSNYLHVNVDGVNARNAKMNSDSSSMEHAQIGWPLCFLWIDWIKKFDQSPVLNDAFRHCDLTVRRRFDHRKKLAKFSHVPVNKKKRTNVE